MIRIDKIKLKDVQEFFDSDVCKALTEDPISSMRVSSYQNNPRAQADDYILYLLFVNDELAAYRTVLPDELLHQKGVTRFAWFSGNYCHPDHRRKGYSSWLMKEVENDWNGQVIFSHVSPESKAGYLKSGRYELFREYTGKRYFYRSILRKIIPLRYPKFKSILSCLLTGFEFIFNILNDLKNLIFQPKASETVHEASIEELQDLIEGLTFSITSRSINEYRWILQSPWITENGDETIRKDRYHFSLVANQFKNILLKSIDEEGKLNGFCWLVVHDHKMMEVYSWNQTEEVSFNISNEIISQAKRFKIGQIDVFSEELNAALHTKRWRFLFRKNTQRFYFLHQLLKENIETDDEQFFHPGDSDIVFTL